MRPEHGSTPLSRIEPARRLAFAVSKARMPYLALAALLAGALALPVYLSAERDIDPDEIEHVRASWLVSQDRVPYRDFFFNHNPLLWYILSHLVAALGPRPSTVEHLRTVMLIVPFAIAALTYKLGRLLLGPESRAPLMGCLSLLYLPVFLDKTIEIRPDGPMVVLWLVSLCLCLSAIRREGRRSWPLAFLSGLAMGLSFAFKQTALLALIPMVAAMLFLLARREIGLPSPVAFLAGFLSIGAAFALAVHASVGLDLYYECCASYNLHLPRFLSLRGFFRSVAGNPFFFVAGFSGALAALLSPRKGDRDARADLLVLVSAAFLLGSFFVVRAPWSQYLLPALPLLSIYAGGVLETALSSLGDPGGPRTRSLAVVPLILFVLGGVALPLWSIARPEPGFSPFYQGFSSRRRMQLDTMDFILENTSPEEPVFDGFAIYVFRPAACRCWSLGFVTGDRRVDEWLGCTPQQVIDCLQGVRIMVEDKRVLKMKEGSDDLERYIEIHFNPPDEKGIRLRRTQEGSP